MPLSYQDKCIVLPLMLCTHVCAIEFILQVYETKNKTNWKTCLDGSFLSGGDK